MVNHTQYQQYNNQCNKGYLYNKILQTNVTTKADVRIQLTICDNTYNKLEGDNPDSRDDNKGENPDNKGKNPHNNGKNPDNKGKNPDNKDDNPDNKGKNSDNKGDNPDCKGDNADNKCSDSFWYGTCRWAIEPFYL